MITGRRSKPGTVYTGKISLSPSLFTTKILTLQFGVGMQITAPPHLGTQEGGSSSRLAGCLMGRRLSVWPSGVCRC